MADNNIELIIKARALLNEASAQISAFTQQVEQQTVQATQKSKVSFSEMATAATVVAGAVAGVAAGIGAMGARGADVLDLRDSFTQLNVAIGNDAVATLNTLRSSFAGTVSDAQLLQLANQALTAGLKASEADFALLADSARILADRTGMDATTAFNTLAQSMATGRTRGAEMLVGVIDNTAAIQAYADKVGKAAKDLSEQEKVEALAIATKERLKTIVEANGKAQVDFGDKIAASKASVANFVDGLNSWIATSPQIGQWASVITAASGAVSLVSGAVGPLKKAFTTLLPMIGASGLSGAFAGLSTFLTGTIVPLISSTLPIALKGLAALFTMPAGLVVAGILAGLAVWQKWDTIGPIVKNVYGAVKEWLVDKFAAVVKWIGEKVGAVTGFFKNMYDAVVGHSFVPDMIKGIEVEFGKLDTVMVGPTFNSTQQVSGLFSNMFTGLQSQMPGWMGGLFGEGGALGTLSSSLDGFMGKVTGKLQGMIGGLFGQGGGGGMFGSLLQQGLGFFLGPAGPLGPLIQQGIGALTDLAVKGLKKLGGWIKGLFGGPSEQELEGREVAKNFRQGLLDGLNPQQMAEVQEAIKGAWKGNEVGAATVIAIRDAYVAVGVSAEEALADADRLWRAEKEGGEAVQQVIDEIRAKMDRASQAQKDLTSSAVNGFDRVKDSIRTVGREMQIIRDEFGNEIVVPVRYDIQGAPDGIRTAADIARAAEQANAGGTGDTSEANREDRQAVARERVLAYIDARRPKWEELQQFMQNNPGDWDRAAQIYGAAGGGVYAKPVMRVIAERSPEIVGQPNTIVSALATAMERVGFAGRTGGAATINFNLTTPLATVDTVRQMVYSEIGPLFLDWLEGNKSGSRTRLQVALGIPTR